MADGKDEITQQLVALTPREQRYVQLRAEGMTKTVSALGAGYSDPTEGKRLEKRPGVSNAIRAIREDSAHQMRLTRDDVLRGFMDAVRAADSSTELVNAWREIGKMLGHYEPEIKKVEISATVEQGLKRIQILSDAELARLSGMDTKLVIEDVDFERVDD